MRWTPLASTLLACTAFVGCGDAEQVHPDSLEQLVKSFRAAVAAKNDVMVAQLALSVCPTTAELREILRPGKATDRFIEALAFKDRRDKPETGPRTGRQLAPLLESRPEQTEVRVHAATTAELKAYRRGGAVWQEFRRDMAIFAVNIAASGRTWLKVEFAEPGQDAGKPLYCFTKVRGRFLLLRDPWLIRPAGR